LRRATGLAFSDKARAGLSSALAIKLKIDFSGGNIKKLQTGDFL